MLRNNSIADRGLRIRDCFHEVRKRPKWAILVLSVFLLSSCASKQSSVFVDVSQVEAIETIPSVIVVPSATPPPAFGNSALTLPPLPGATYKLSTDQARVKEVQQIIEKSREQALVRIAAQLKETYLRDIKRIETEEVAKLKPEEKAKYEKALAAAQEVFEDYSLKRGKATARLALLVGYPDPDPTSQRTGARSTNPLVRKRFAEAKELRTQIKELDDLYESHVSGIFGQAKGEVTAQLARIRMQAERMRGEADLRAQREAQAEVAKEQAQLRSVLADQGAVSFAPQPGRTVTVEGSKPPAEAPRVDVPGKEQMQLRLKQAIASDLKIWEALKGYKVSTDRGNLPDLTAEFIQWRKTHLGTP